MPQSPVAENVLARNVTVTGNLTVGSSASVVSQPATVLYPNLPAFLVISTATQSDVTGAATAVAVAFGSKSYDRTTSYSTSAFAFTAPVAGLYNFAGAVALSGLTSNHTQCSVQVTIATTNVYTPNTIAYASAAGVTVLTLPWSLQVNASAGATVTVEALVAGASGGVDIVGGSTQTPQTWFSGYLVG
jgi:hypothetical protein